MGEPVLDPHERGRGKKEGEGVAELWAETPEREEESQAFLRNKQALDVQVKIGEMPVEGAGKGR